MKRERVALRGGTGAGRGFAKRWRGQGAWILMVLPGIVVLLIFNYLPMYGITLAFKDYRIVDGILGSPWAGLRHFRRFFANPLALRVLSNTFILGLYSLLWTFPMPIILALLLNELRSQRFKRTVQTISYFPTFVSVVVVAGMLREFVAREGLVNQFLGLFGVKPILFLNEARYFRTLFISSGIWQIIGFGAIIYLAALAGIDPTLYEVATIDGASRWQRMRHITWPGIRPTTVIQLLFSIGGILGTDFQKVMLLYNPRTYRVADVIGSYVYREGIQGAQYEYTTAIGLFMSLISFAILFVANTISRHTSETSLW